jgi:hypothetical protein
MSSRLSAGFILFAGLLATYAQRSAIPIGLSSIFFAVSHRVNAFNNIFFFRYQS